MEGVPLGPQEKPGTVVFLPGTGRPNPALSDQVREQVNAVPGFSGWSVRTIDWAAAAADNVSAVPALPERYSAEDPPALSDGSLALALFGADVSTADPMRRAAAAAPSVPETALLGETLQDLVLGVVTDAAVRHRIRLTDAAGDFFSKVAYYLRQGESARLLLAEALAGTDQDAPVILFAHSLGSVAAVDLLSSPDFAASRVDLLVTLGSPAPWFYLLDALAYAGPGRGGNAPAAPWLNFWDERDLFAFCAERVFAGRMGRITDREVQSGKPFPESHHAYFSDPQVYRLLWDHLQETESGKPGSGNGTGL